MIQNAGGAPVRIIDSPQPRVGVVIGSFAALPYIHLQLESRKRFWPDVPLLVHDDCSPIQDELAALCASYGAAFVSTPQRLEHYRGDIQAFVAGLDWAQKENIELLVKVSRRYLIFKSWVSALQDLAFTTQYATYGNACADQSFPIRSECMAMHAPQWHKSGVVDAMRQQVENCDLRIFRKPLEYWYFQLAQQVSQSMPLTRAALRDLNYPRGAHWNGSYWGGYGIWPLLGDGCKCPPPGVLWRYTHQATDYLAKAHEWRLSDYDEADFADPNLGRGVGGSFLDRRRSLGRSRRKSGV